MKGSRNQSQKKVSRAKSTTSRAASNASRFSSMTQLSTLSAASFSTKRSTSSISPSMSLLRGVSTANISSATAKKTAMAAATPTTSVFSRFFSSAENFFKPNSNRVLVKKEAPPQPKTASGILIPQSQVRSNALRAEVVAVGPGLRNSEGNYVKPFANVGDKVVLPDFGGTELKFGEETYHLYRDDDILGIVPQ